MDMHMLQADASQAKRWRALREEMVTGKPGKRWRLLETEAKRQRRDDLHMIERSGQGHVGGDMSVMDILAVLFGYVMDIDPEDPNRPDRDRFVLSKGHTAGALYSVLANCGFFAPAELETFLEPMSALNGHPNRLKVPGVEANTGPLGHGLPIAVGMAHAARLQGYDYRVFVVLGDGELQEGSNWEAFMHAPHFGLERLFAVIDRNGLQQGARTEDTTQMDSLEEKLAAFGWEVRSADGHDYDELINAFRPSERNLPVAVVANTVKGKGISYMEDNVVWHHKVPSSQEYEEALEELA